MTNPVRQAVAAMAAAAVLAVAPANDVRPLNIVWFAGGGGSSEGMREAGFDPDYALNHNATALWMHQVNHPDCTHLCDDATEVRPLTLEPGRRIRVFWASPDCTHFSVARGSAPKSPRIRGLAWCILPWAKLRQPDVIFIENVREFLTWGPLDAEGQPIKRMKGETFRKFVRRLRQAGYIVEWRELNAADYGAATTRKRLFIIARRDGEAIEWPKPTHAPPDLAEELGLLPYASAASIIDWSIRCPSIFLSQEDAKAEGLRIKRPLVAATLSRVAKGIERYIIKSPNPFIVPVTHHGKRNIRTTADQLPTITAAHRGELMLAAPTIVPILNRTWAPDRVDAADVPLRTITTAKGGEFMLAEASLTAATLDRHFGTNVAGKDIQDPAPTIMSDGGGGKLSVIAASLTTFYGRSVGSDVNDGVLTITGKDRHGVVSANLTSYYGTGVGSDVREGVRTITGEDRHGLTSVFLEQANTGVVGHDVREGVSTITGRATQQRLIEARLQAMGAAPDSRRRAVLRFLWDHFGEPTEADWTAPMGSDLARLRFGLVVVKGVVFEIADIGMRMLTVRELFCAQGFRPDYIIDRDPWDRPISGTAATLMVGNSVPPPLARALCAANLNTPEPREERVAA